MHSTFYLLLFFIFFFFSRFQTRSEGVFNFKEQIQSSAQVPLWKQDLGCTNSGK